MATTYRVTYNANGGSGPPNSQTKTAGKTLVLATSEPLYTGHVFKYWNTKSDGTGTTYYPGGNYSQDAAVTLYAIWDLIEYEIRYDLNLPSGFDGQSWQPSQVKGVKTKKYGVAYTIPTAVPSIEGYDFVEWRTSSNGSGTRYLPGGTYNTNANLTLYAVWSQDAYLPVINSVDIHRSPDEYVGTNVVITAEVYLANESADITATQVTQYRLIRCDNVNPTTVTRLSRNTFRVTFNFGNVPIDQTRYFSLQIYQRNATEPLVTRTVIAPSGKFGIDVLPNCAGVSIGKAAAQNREGFLDVAFNAHFDKKLVANGEIASNDTLRAPTGIFNDLDTYQLMVNEQPVTSIKISPFQGHTMPTDASHDGTVGYVILGPVMICWGETMITPDAANTGKNKVINFPRTFGATPIVVCGPGGSPATDRHIVSCASAATDKWTAYLNSSSSTANRIINWIAIGKAPVS